MEEKKDEYKKLKSYALWLLSRQAMPTARLKEKLIKKEFAIENIKKLIEELENWGYLNDREWAKSFARVQQRKNYAWRLVKQKLKMKGIEESIISEIDADASKQDQQGNIRELMMTKYKSRDLTDIKEKNKVIAALMRRGFDYQQIDAVLSNVIP